MHKSPFGDGIGAGDGVEVLEDAGNGLEEADGSRLHGLQVELLLQRLVQPLCLHRRRLGGSLLLLLL